MTLDNESGRHPVAANDPAAHRSTARLLSDAVNQMAELFRKEMQLLRAEMGEKTNHVFAAVGMIVGGIVLVLVALNALMAALVALLVALGLEEGWAALIAGVVVAVIAYALVSIGRRNLSASHLAPGRTAASIQRDAELARESTR